MPIGLPIALLLGTLFGGLLWVLPVSKMVILLAGFAITLTLLRKPLWGLLIFAVLATSIPYTTVQVGIAPCHIGTICKQHIVAGTAFDGGDVWKGDVLFMVDDRAARAALEGSPVDAIVQDAAGRRKRLLIADMDSTMITVECIDELADYAGIKPEIAAITERAMAGELDFAEALKARVALLDAKHPDRLTAPP